MNKIRINAPQMERLISFMEENPEMVNSKSDGLQKERKEELWTILTDELNSMIGAQKTKDKWKKSWIDLKSSCKEKIKAASTGGAPAGKQITCLEERIANLMGYKFINGIAGISEIHIEENDLQPEPNTVSEYIAVEFSDVSTQTASKARDSLKRKPLNNDKNYEQKTIELQERANIGFERQAAALEDLAVNFTNIAQSMQIHAIAMERLAAAMETQAEEIRNLATAARDFINK